MSHEKSPSFALETTPVVVKEFNATNYLGTNNVDRELLKDPCHYNTNFSEEVGFDICPKDLKNDYPFVYFKRNNITYKVSLQFSACEYRMHETHLGYHAFESTTFFYQNLNIEPMKNILNNVSLAFYKDEKCEDDPKNCIASLEDRKKGNLSFSYNMPLKYNNSIKWPIQSENYVESDGKFGSISIHHIWRDDFKYTTSHSKYNDCKLGAYFNFSIVNAPAGIDAKKALYPVIRAVNHTLKNPDLQKYLSNVSNGTIYPEISEPVSRATPVSERRFNATQHIVGNENTLISSHRVWPHAFFNYNGTTVKITFEITNCINKTRQLHNINIDDVDVEPMKKIMRNLASDAYEALPCKEDEYNCVSTHEQRIAVYYEYDHKFVLTNRGTGNIVKKMSQVQWPLETNSSSNNLCYKVDISQEAYYALDGVDRKNQTAKLFNIAKNSVENTFKNPELQKYISEVSNGTIYFTQPETPSPLAVISPSNLATPSPEVVSPSIQASSPANDPAPVASSTYNATSSPTISSGFEASPSSMLPVQASSPSNGSFPFQAPEPKSVSGLTMTDISLISAGCTILTAGLVIGLVKARKMDPERFDRGVAAVSNAVATVRDGASGIWNSAKSAVSGWMGSNPDVYQNANPETDITFVAKLDEGRSRSSSLNEGFAKLVRQRSESSSSSELQRVVIS